MMEDLDHAPPTEAQAVTETAPAIPPSRRSKKPRRTPEELLAAARKKREQATAREQRYANQIRIADEKRRTRQLILFGTAVRAEMESDPAFATRIKGLLHRHMTRDHDREVMAEFLA